MDKISVIIIAKNEAASIAAAVSSAALISDDIVVVDSGSTDDTVAIARQLGARIMQIAWKGFGNARNKGASGAAHQFVFCLDADEVVTPQLAAAVKDCKGDPDVLYGFRRRNFLAQKEILHGEWAHDVVYRLYHRARGTWNLDKVHESVVIRGGRREKIGGSLLHYTTAGLDEYRGKLDRYAQLSAEKFMQAGKRAAFTKLYLSPVFSFFKNYVLRGGFLDGKNGFAIAVLHASYTHRKYAYLGKLLRQQKK